MVSLPAASTPSRVPIPSGYTYQLTGEHAGGDETAAMMMIIDVNRHFTEQINSRVSG